MLTCLTGSGLLPSLETVRTSDVESFVVRIHLLLSLDIARNWWLLAILPLDCLGEWLIIVYCSDQSYSAVGTGPCAKVELSQAYSHPQVERIWGIWGSYQNIPKVIFDLLKGDDKPTNITASAQLCHGDYCECSYFIVDYNVVVSILLSLCSPCLYPIMIS